MGNAEETGGARASAFGVHETAVAHQAHDIGATRLPRRQAIEPHRSSQIRTAAGTVLLSWLAPTKVAQRTAGLPLVLAWLVHFASAVAGVCLIVLLVAWTEANYGGLADVAAQIGKLFAELSNEARANGPLFAASALGIFALVEGVHFAVGLLLMPWGAKDEPLSHTLRHSLRQTWLHTSHFLVGILVVGCVALFFEYLDREWQVDHPRPFPVAVAAPVPPSDTKDAEAQAKYQTALNEYNRQVSAAYTNWQQQWQEWRGRRPWYLREPEAVVACSVMANLLWILGALLCAVGVARWTPSVERPPLCTDCGYNLLTISMQSRCPECGEAVASSLGSEAQPGMPWERRGHLGTVAAWWNTALLTLRLPTESGRRLKVVEPGRDHRRFFAAHLPLIGAISAAAFLIGIVGANGPSEFQRVPLIAIGMPVMFALLCVVGAIGATLFGAWATGLGLSVRHKRNLMPASMQMACYLAPFLVLWELVGAGLVLSCAYLEERHSFFSAIEQQTGMYADLAIFLYVGLPNILLGLLYLYLIHCGTLAARFANR